MLGKAAAISTGPDTHLDHLAFLCALLKMPLIISDANIYGTAKEFYPQVSLAYHDYLQLSADFLARFDTIFECGKFWTLELSPIFELFYQKKMRFICCPHGNSDKGSALNLQHIPLEFDVMLTYGDHMHQLITKTGTLNDQCALICMGDLRYQFYLKHRSHFDRLASNKIFQRFSNKKPYVLYAPTWNSEESPSSFLHVSESIIKQLSSDYHLIIKLHPLLEEHEPGLTWHFIGKYEDHPDILILREFPAIFPILEKIDLYLGDFSSIGYDFLRYNRPMFFIAPQSKATLLHQCGVLLTQNDIDQLKVRIKDPQIECEIRRKELNALAFSSIITEEKFADALLQELKKKSANKQKSFYG